MTRRVIAEMDDRVVTVRALRPGEPDPSQAVLDAYAVALIAANDGTRPVVKVEVVEVTNLYAPIAA